MKSGYQKTLKVISIITVIFAILIMLFAILLIISGGIVGSALSDPEANASLSVTYNENPIEGISAEQAVALTAGFGILGGIFVLIEGVLALIVGILGIRGANDPTKIGPFRVFAIIGFICSLLYILVLCFGAGTWEVWISAAIDVIITGLCVWLSYKIKGQTRVY